MSEISLTTRTYGEAGRSAPAGTPRPGSLSWLCSRYGNTQFERITRLTAMNRLPGESSWSAYLRHNRTGLAVISGRVSGIPATGPLMLVANHPTGFPDGPTIGHLLGQVRRDFKALGARQLMDLPVAPDIIPISTDGQLGVVSDDTATFNRRGFREAFRWLQQGHCLFVFPCGSGHGAKVRSGSFGRLVDGPWAHNVIGLARKAGATIVPIRIHSDPGLIRAVLHRVGRQYYQLASKVEVLRARGAVYQLSILPPRRPEQYGDTPDATLAELLRCQCTGIAPTPVTS